MTGNINLLYSGGSGGFCLLHFLLLSDKWFCKFPVAMTLEQIISSQWHITDSRLWKRKEIYPDNDATAHTPTALNKIFMYVNPWSTTPKPYCNRNLVLYTDFQSQHKLAYYKRANWYYSHLRLHGQDRIFLIYRNLLKKWREHYANIRDPSWPKCVSFRHIKKLPKHVQKDLLSNPHTDYFLRYDIKEDYLPPENLNQHLIDPAIMPWLESAQIKINLQEFVNSRGQVLVVNGLLDCINKKQLDFLEKWIKLHPVELLADIGITPT